MDREAREREQERKDQAEADAKATDPHPDITPPSEVEESDAPTSSGTPPMEDEGQEGA